THLPEVLQFRAKSAQTSWWNFAVLVIILTLARLYANHPMRSVDIFVLDWGCHVILELILHFKFAGAAHDTWLDVFLGSYVYSSFVYKVIIFDGR
ncbi:hypothetical protein ACJX0J_010324, partial [Zea mays]